MENNNGTPASQEKDIFTLVEEKISNDADFQTELESLSDEDKTARLSEKKAELVKQEYETIAQKAKKDAELANNYKIRAEKAEKGSTKKDEPEISIQDMHALRDVHEEDIDEVLSYAKFKNITARDALKVDVIKTFIADRAEKRKTAQATNINTGRRGVTPNTGETMLSEAMKTGKLPSTDEEMTKMTEARLKRKFSKK